VDFQIKWENKFRKISYIFLKTMSIKAITTLIIFLEMKNR